MLLAALAPPLCAACGAWAARTEPLCTDCRAELRWLPPEPVFLGALALWAPVAYDGPARALVRGLKFGGVTRAAAAMAAQIAANAPPAILQADALVPVPLHPARLRRRGFNQAARIATELARRSGLPVHDCLQRAGPAGTQVGRGRAQRLEGLTGRVHARPGEQVPHAAVIVDDVATTGATLGACAAALGAAGATRVTALAYARTPGR